VLAWAHDRRLITSNPCTGGTKLYSSTRVSKVWDAADIDRFLRTAPLYLRLALLLAVNTGQRQGRPAAAAVVSL